jgi:putative endonuclease
VLENLNGDKYYIGYTNNLARRLLEYNKKNSRRTYTKTRGPWCLLFYESFDSRSEAIKQEKFFKTGKGREYIKEKIEDKVGA